MGHGRAALIRRLKPSLDKRHRSITGAVLWCLQAAIVSLQQFLPGGEAMPTTLFALFITISGAMAISCLAVGPRLGDQAFARAEEGVVILGLAATTAMVAATGGASSADLGLFANVMFYCAYFLPSRRAVVHVLIGTALMWLPLLYDSTSAIEEGFISRAAVMSVVLWVMAILISRNRHLTMRAETEAKRLALTDPLTGVANLHTFNEETLEMIARAAKADEQFGVAFVDVNGLKAANTVLGHAGGDELIRCTARALVIASGKGDQVARVGGDEFAVLLPGADAQRMRAFESSFAGALSEQQGPGPGEGVTLSASIGSAVFPQDGLTAEQLMDVADSRMYESKASLPRRLAVKETSGGRSLSDGATQPIARMPFLLGGGAGAASVAWLLGGATITLGAMTSEVGQGGVSLALLLAGFCVLVSGALALVDPARRQQAEAASNAVAILVALPAVYATGGAASPILPLAYLVVAHSAYALSGANAALRIGAILALLSATLVAAWGTAEFARVLVIFSEVLVIAGLLRVNRARAQAAQHAALELSRRDALTGLANRRVFERELSRCNGDSADRRACAGGLILVDVDDFKEINSFGGHKAGDAVLKKIAGVLDRAAGESATVCRIGGDEFAVIHAGGDAASIMRSASRLRDEIASVNWNELGIPSVTLSAGWATWEHVDDWKELVVAADLAMHISKQAGKNSVHKAPVNANSAMRASAGVAAAV